MGLGIGGTLISITLLFSLGSETILARQVRAPALVVSKIIKSQHARIQFQNDIQRVAVGDSELLAADVINSRELLVLGKDTGRTTLIVWFRNGSVEEYLYAVQPDLSMLEAALKRVYPSVEAEMAPDRDAIVLTGIVPDITYSQAAESVARNYLEAGGTRGAASRPLVRAEGQPPSAAAPQAGQPPAADATQPPPEQVRAPVDVPASKRIINLIQLQTLPALPEERIKDAIRSIGGSQVSVRRVLKGAIRDDNRDILILEGMVPNQIVLMRILAVSSQIFTGQATGMEDIRVIGDEGGALAQTQAQPSAGGLGTSGGGLFGGGSQRLNNDVRQNLARAKAIQLAGGRILSFVGVADLPQVRVGVKLVEINRTKLKTYNSDLGVLASDFNQPALRPSPTATLLQSDRAATVGDSGHNAVQSALGFLAGALSHELQFASGHFALDTALSILERVGLARTLSSPTLTVLAGETAVFQVGGEIPVPESFAPSFATIVGAGGTAAATGGPQGVFSSVAFRQFGILLNVRPLVGDDGMITLDLQPQIITPDASLTGAIRQSTGLNPATTAFQTRTLRTSTRLEDGQALLLGGLLSRTSSDTETSTPGIREAPVLGWLFKGFSRSDDDFELVVMVNPVIVREKKPDVNLWTFPDIWELPKGVTPHP